MAALPLSVPRINDAQRLRVLRAENAIRSRTMFVNEVETLLTNVGASAVRSTIGCVEYFGGRLEIPTYPRELHLLHALAHLRTSEVFPAHGVEWASELLDLADQHVPHLGSRIRTAFGREQVTVDPEVANLRAVQRVGWVARNVPESVIRIVLADPPEEVVGIFVDLVGDDVRLLCRRGIRILEAQRLRYVSQPKPMR